MKINKTNLGIGFPDLDYPGVKAFYAFSDCLAQTNKQTNKQTFFRYFRPYNPFFQKRELLDSS